jgi:hypothetical protein
LYSKRQNTIETSTFGTEFGALKIAVEMNEASFYKLRMIGVPIDGPTNEFCDNRSVVTNSVIPQFTVNKKNNSSAYHKVQDSVASEAIRIAHEKGEDKLSDVLTNFLPAQKFKACVQCILTRRMINPYRKHELRCHILPCRGLWWYLGLIGE